MSSDFTSPLCSWLSDTNHYTNEINNLFHQYWKILGDERQRTMDVIDKWRRDSEERINNYAEEQKTLIIDHYNRQRLIFDNKHKENLETANSYYNARQLDLFNDLRKACQSLEFQVTLLTFANYGIKQPEVIIVDKPLKTTNLEETNLDTRNDARLRRRRDKTNVNKIENTSDTNASSSSNSAALHPKQTDDQQSSKVKSQRRNNQSAVNTDDSKEEVMNNDESNNKCPICFMIFPLSMTRRDRQQHVNEHYTDD